MSPQSGLLIANYPSNNYSHFFHPSRPILSIPRPPRQHFRLIILFSWNRWALPKFMRSSNLWNKSIQTNSICQNLYERNKEKSEKGGAHINFYPYQHNTTPAAAAAEVVAGSTKAPSDLEGGTEKINKYRKNKFIRGKCFLSSIYE